MWVRFARRAFQLAIVGLAAAAGIRYALGLSLSGIEKFCPFGGLETSYALLTQQQFTCAAGEANLSLFLALLLLAVLARKAFCGWICPVGTVAEGLAWIGAKLRRRPTPPRRRSCGMVTPPGGWDRALRWLRLPVLLAILLFTFGTGELIFRPYDPYYVMFSAHGHDVRWWSYPLVAVLMGLAVVVPMAWCRYLCPLGGALWPLARTGRLRVRRHAERCVSCGACDSACPHSLPVATGDEVVSGECTLCMECVVECPQEGALSLGLGHGARRRTTAWVVPALVVMLAAAGLASTSLFAIPSYAREYDRSGPTAQAPATTRMEVSGVRCVDTARRAAAQLEGIEGVLDLTAYAARHLLEIRYDAGVVSVEDVRGALERPVFDQETETFIFDMFRVVAIDDRDVAR